MNDSYFFDSVICIVVVHWFTGWCRAFNQDPDFIRECNGFDEEKCKKERTIENDIERDKCVWHDL
jgi:hypothetical protein